MRKSVRVRHRLLWAPAAFVGGHSALVLFLATEQLASAGRKGLFIPVDVLGLPSRWIVHSLGVSSPFGFTGSHEQWTWHVARWYAFFGGLQWCVVGLAVGLYQNWTAPGADSGERCPSAPVSGVEAARSGCAWVFFASLVTICFLWLYSVPRAQRARLQEQVEELKATVQWLAESRDAYAEGHGGAWPVSMSEVSTGGGDQPVGPWGHGIRLVPADSPGAPPAIVSLGRDGLLGGDGPDADVRR